MRNFGISTGRRDQLGGNQLPPPVLRDEVQARNVIQLAVGARVPRPPASLTTRSLGTRGEKDQAPSPDQYPLPAQSPADDPFMTDSDRSRIVGRLMVAFLSLWFLIPMICIGIVLGAR